MYGDDGPQIFYTDNISDKAFLEKCFPSLKLGITPIDKFSELPEFQIPAHVQIFNKSSVSQIETALATIQELLIELPESENITIGFDLEWIVDITPGKSRQGKTAVATIAHDNTIYLLQIARLHGNKFPRALTNFCLEPCIIKVGSRIKSDLQRLQKESGSEREFSGFIELAHMAKAY